MGNIVLLDDLTINKIAAGEVIERPASVVKEMLENSIDAGATNVNIEVQNGGISKIRITDNGKGMEPDDMVIAFERHATSKIRKADDLEYVRTMGFRGEALASIAAIAKVEMISRTENSDTGYKVVIEAGNVLSEELVAAPVGTTITVEKLFFNTPVRYKFLKKDYTEAGYIEDAVKRIALVNPNIAIKLINNGKVAIQSNGSGKLEDVIYGIYGKDIVDGLLPIDYKYENIFIKGVVGKPEIARSNRGNQMFFVNNRYVKDKTLSAAVEQAMKGMLPIGKFPFLVLNIEMDPKMVDVNVHPAKLEVRFVDEGEVFKAVMYAIKESLLAGSLISNVSKEKSVDEIYQSHFEKKNNLEQLKEEIRNGVQQEIPQDNNVKKEIFESQEVEEVKEEKPKHIAKNIVDLFKKVSKEKEEEYKNDNIISDIFNTRNGNTQNEADKLEEEKFEYEKENLYKFEDLKKLQSEVLKDIEKMPVIIDEKEKNEVEEIKDRIFSRNENKEVQQTQMEKQTEVESLPKIDEKQEPKMGQEQQTEENVLQPQPAMPTVEIHEEPQDFNDMYEKTFGTVPATAKKQEIKFENLQYVESENISMFTKNNKYQGYKFIGIAFSTYIILEIEDELYILDQHAAHERIMYEKVKANYYSGNKDCQMMLLPDVINLTNKEMCILRENMEIFEKAGFKVEEFGDRTVKLVGVPSMCMDMDTKSLFLDILDEIDTVARTERQEVEEKFIATVACKSAVKANMNLELPEVIALLDKLMELPNPFTCPHGRPTAIKMTKNDIERKFSRR